MKQGYRLRAGSELELELEKDEAQGVATAVYRLSHQSSGRVAEVAGDADVRRDPKSKPPRTHGAKVDSTGGCHPSSAAKAAAR